MNHPVHFPGFLPVEVGSETTPFWILLMKEIRLTSWWEFIALFTRLYTSHVVQDVFHPQCVSSSTSPQKDPASILYQTTAFSLSTPQKIIYTPPKTNIDTNSPNTWKEIPLPDIHFFRSVCIYIYIDILCIILLTYNLPIKNDGGEMSQNSSSSSFLPSSPKNLLRAQEHQLP